jgi:hypothetical protein
MMMYRLLTTASSPPVSHSRQGVWHDSIIRIHDIHHSVLASVYIVQWTVSPGAQASVALLKSACTTEC